jgi:hypothetical protein
MQDIKILNEKYNQQANHLEQLLAQLTVSYLKYFSAVFFLVGFPCMSGE